MGRIWFVDKKNIKKI